MSTVDDGFLQLLRDRLHSIDTCLVEIKTSIATETSSTTIKIAQLDTQSREMRRDLDLLLSERNAVTASREAVKKTFSVKFIDIFVEVFKWVLILFCTYVLTQFAPWMVAKP